MRKPVREAWKETCLGTGIVPVDLAEEQFQTVKVSDFEISLPVVGIRLVWRNPADL
jgi:hypothetical protein